MSLALGKEPTQGVKTTSLLGQARAIVNQSKLWCRAENSYSV